MLIDLSIRLNENTPAYPGDPKIAVIQTENFAEQGYYGHQITLGTHTGTHVDAPAHMLEGGRSLGDFPLETFIAPGKCVDVRSGFTVEACEIAGISEGDIVLLHTGMANKFYESAYFSHYPVMDNVFADYLVHQKVKMIGLDTCSADNAKPFPVHKTLLGNNILIIENLTNLDQLPASGFTVVALPINLDLEGAPARVIAQMETA